jgi:predicted RNA-binding Zn ribbon-like protein
VSIVSDDKFGGLDGDHLCLDLVNTISPRLGDHREDKLATYADLLDWGRQAGVLSPEGALALSERARQAPAEASAALERAKDLRETIARIFAATAAGERPGDADLAGLRDAFAEAMRHAQITERDGGFGWEWAAADALDGPTWPATASAMEVLTSAELDRVKECPGNDDCGWFFLDTSKNLSRRWCSMETCGSRAKMRRHYARKRAREEVRQEQAARRAASNE